MGHVERIINIQGWNLLQHFSVVQQILVRLAAFLIKLVHASHRTVMIVEIQPYIQCIFVWLTKIITQLYIIGGV